MLEYLYQIEQLFEDVEILKAGAIILGIATAFIISITISNACRINAIERQLYFNSDNEETKNHNHQKKYYSNEE